MTSTKPSNLIWTKEECQTEALKYIYKKDFIKQSYGSYQASLRNKWIDEICSHMIPLGNKYNRLIYRIIFPDNVCYVGLTNDFDRRMYEHLNKKGTVYSYIYKTKLLPINIEKLTDYIPITEAKIQEEYWKCKSEDNGYICLNIAKTGGVGANNLKWNKYECQKVANKYNIKIDFITNESSAYNSARKYGWLDEICSHMIALHINWTKDDCKNEALKYNHRGEFSKNNRIIWAFAQKHNWLDEICSHMTLKHNSYSKDECKIEALKYNSRNEFKKNNNSMWQCSNRHKWSDEICSHMIPLRHTWTIEECKTEAKKYKNTTEFSRKSHNMYEFSRKRNGLMIYSIKNN